MPRPGTPKRGNQWSYPNLSSYINRQCFRKQEDLSIIRKLIWPKCIFWKYLCSAPCLLIVSLHSWEETGLGSFASLQAADWSVTTQDLFLTTILILLRDNNLQLYDGWFLYFLYTSKTSIRFQSDSTLCNNLDYFYGLLIVSSIMYVGSLSQIRSTKKGMLMGLIALM